jgi:hypothetical protein
MYAGYDDQFLLMGKSGDEGIAALSEGRKAQLVEDILPDLLKEA